ncbi:metal-dependent hydrolase [Segniliparus rugosus]|uniref:Metal-dependent hydrolase n=1 Tax=Segniliparus rugosus (strain ATCC BAA-974 / DSM 45345 / CCUG 50838 / CIP 108380 / JCM 13579 / CDC 945) TaxID=679197 RepID=E5XR89_SEGRC|nr:metal-dependent hydrolase [Segniliparus rugosus]EFV13130.1 hypothetical protein HMPREF9336_02011 [Segniliparus rugosus ATCC BAA-974]
MSNTQNVPNEIGRVAVHSRDVRFDCRETPVHWLAKEPYASHWASSVHFIFPMGESLMAETVRRAAEHITDPELYETALGFAAQESAHAKAHDSALRQFFIRGGIDPEPLVKQAAFAAATGMKILNSVKGAASHRLLVLNLAVFSGVEMIATSMGAWILSADLEKFGADPVMADLFRWHSAEEVEHRSAVFDVARYFGLGYIPRVLLGVGTALGIYFLMARGTKFLVHADPSLPNLGYFGLIREWVRASKRGALPPLRILFTQLKDYCKPSYSPEDVGDMAQAVAYLAKSPAVRSATL